MHGGREGDARSGQLHGQVRARADLPADVGGANRSARAQHDGWRQSGAARHRVHDGDHRAASVRSGISAQDRSTTILQAVREDASGSEFITPGYVYPLRARDGGVLVRTGQTEGAVDLARLAGLKPAGVICEILKEDGTMARRDDLVEFAKVHGLKIVTVADIIEYRLRNETMVQRIAEAKLPTAYGEFSAIVYRNLVDQSEHLVLVMGKVDPKKPILVRAHREYLPGDVFGYPIRNTRNLLRSAMERISAAGEGVTAVSQARVQCARRRISTAGIRRVARRREQHARGRFPRLRNRRADPARRGRAQDDYHVGCDAAAGQSAGLRIGNRRDRYRFPPTASTLSPRNRCTRLRNRGTARAVFFSGKI